MLPNSQRMLQTALACHQSGDLSQADAIYAQIVAHDATCSEAVHLRGVVAYQKGDYPAAIVAIQRALSLAPSGRSISTTWASRTKRWGNGRRRPPRFRQR